MNYLGQLQRSVEFIEHHLDDDLTLGEVAKAAGISRWHFQRIFRAMTGETVKAYIRARRLARSLERLRETDLRILDIAMMAGFGSQEAFARAFKKAFGITPSTYRARGGGPLLEKARFDEAYLRHVAEQGALEPKLIGRPATTFVGLRTSFFGPDSERNNIAEKLPPLWDVFMERCDDVDGRVPGVCWGIVEQGDSESEALSYIAAVEVRGHGPTLPADMVRRELPAATYAQFEHHGLASSLDHTVSYIYSTWLLQSGRRHTYGPDLERYDHDFHPTSSSSVVGYAIPVTD